MPTGNSRRHKTVSNNVAVVLGGSGGAGEKYPGEVTFLRAEAAAELATLNPQMVIICSGLGSAKQAMANAIKLPEARQIAQVLVAHGIARRRLFLERESVDTIGNAILSYARFLHGCGPGRLTVVTSPFHMERALFTFRGVVDPSWQVAGLECPPAGNDAHRRATDDGGKGWTSKFFQGTTPGDLPVLAAKLLAEGKPFYKQNKLLTRLSKTKRIA